MAENERHSCQYQAWPGAPMAIVMTRPLAEALDVLIAVSAEVAAGETSRTALRIALGGIKELHDYETMHLGGEPLAQPSPAQPGGTAP